MALITMIGAGLFGFVCATLSYLFGAGFGAAAMIYAGSGWLMGGILLLMLSRRHQTDATRLVAEIEADLRALREARPPHRITLERSL